MRFRPQWVTGSRFLWRHDRGAGCVYRYGRQEASSAGWGPETLWGSFCGPVV